MIYPEIHTATHTFLVLSEDYASPEDAVAAVSGAIGRGEILYVQPTGDGAVECYVRFNPKHVVCVACRPLG